MCYNREERKEFDFVMAMIKCSECGKEVSSKAKNCVHCGNPLTQIRFNVDKKAIKDYNLTAADIQWLEWYGDEIEPSNIKKAQNVAIIWTTLGICCCFLPLIPYFYYKNQGKPKYAKRFLVASIGFLIVGLILFFVLSPIDL